MALQWQTRNRQYPATRRIIYCVHKVRIAEHDPWKRPVLVTALYLDSDTVVH